MMGAAARLAALLGRLGGAVAAGDEDEAAEDQTDQSGVVQVSSPAPAPRLGRASSRLVCLASPCRRLASRTRRRYEKVLYLAG